MKLLVLFAALSCVAHASEIGTIKGIVMSNGVPVRATIHILQEGYSGVPKAYETVAFGVVTPRFLFGTAITFPLNAPGAYVVATSKKGTFSHAGLPVGKYNVVVEVKGKLVEEAVGVVVGSQKPTALDFDISPGNRK